MDAENRIQDIKVRNEFNEPEYPVIWATTDTSRYFKFGEVVDVE